MAELNAKHVRTSRGSTPSVKKDGYADGTVPPSMRGTKPGKSRTAGYSGPNIAKASRT